MKYIKQFRSVLEKHSTVNNVQFWKQAFSGLKDIKFIEKCRFYLFFHFY